jgi:hypothetical protein
LGGHAIIQVVIACIFINTKTFIKCSVSIKQAAFFIGYPCTMGFVVNVAGKKKRFLLLLYPAWQRQGSHNLLLQKQVDCTKGMNLS